MKPGPKPSADAKRHALTVKFSDAERATVKTLARKTRKPLATYVRDAALSTK